MTVERLLSSMTAEEYLEWDAYFAAESERQQHDRSRAQKGIGQ